MSSNYPDPFNEWWANAGQPMQDAANPLLGEITPFTPRALPSAGSFRLQNMQNDLLQRQQLEQRLFPQATANGVGGQPQGIAPTPTTPTPLIQQPPDAPAWWAQPGSVLGDFERNFARGNVLQKGLSVLELGGKALGSLAQGTEAVIGNTLGYLPQVKVIGGGQVEIKPGLNQQMYDRAQQLQAAAGGQDYSAKYRNATPVLEQPLGGNTPAQFAVSQAQNIAYSGAGTNNPAQIRAVGRITMGEDPTVVLRGLAEPGADAYADEVTRYGEKAQEYVDASGRMAKADALQMKQPPDPRWGSVQNYADAMEAQAREKAAQWITATKRIPGEEDPTREMIGQIILDPMQLPQVAHAQEIMLKPILGKLKGTTQAVDRVATVYNDTLKAQVIAVQTGINPKIQALSEAMGKAADAKPNNVVLDTLDRILKRGVNLFTYTPQTQAKVLQGVAYAQLGNLATAAETGQEMHGWIQQFVENPQALVERLGVTPTSIDAEVVRPVIKDAMEKLQALPSLQAGKEFNPADFLMEADGILHDITKAAAKVPEKLPAWQQWSQSLKSWMSEFMLKTPGYIIRNYISDNAIATMDGLRMFDNMETVTRDLERFGVSTKRLMQTGIAGEEMGSKLAGIPGVGYVQTKLGQIAESGERARFTRAYWSALTDFMGTNWKPAISQETRALFDAAGHGDLIDQMEGALKGARSGKEVRSRMLSMLDAQTPADRFFVTQHVGANDLPTDVAATIEADLRRMQGEGATIEQVHSYLDDWTRQLSEHTKAKLVDLGPVISPRDTTAQDALLDVEESVRAYQRDIGKGVNHGDITQAEATKLIDDFRKGQEAQARAINGARTELAQALGTLGPNVADEHVATVLHAIDGEYDIRQETRPIVDEIRRKAWQQEPSRGVWDQYRADVNAAWGDAGNKTIQRYKDATAALQEIAAGGDPIATMEKYGIKGVATRAEAALGAARATIAAEGLEGFDKGLADARVAWDTARNESRRRLIQMVKANPELAQDGFDVFRSAERDVQRRWDQYIGKKNELLALKDGNKITLEQYGTQLGEEAQKAFAFSTRRHGELLVAQLEGVEIGRSEVARRLKDLGYKGDDLTRMVKGLPDGSTRAEVADILKQGKRAPSAGLEIGDSGVAQSAPAKFSEMQPPATADELLAETSKGESEQEHLQNALDQARRNENTAGGMAQQGGLGAARTEAKGQLPTVAEINKYLKPDGTLKSGDLGEAMNQIEELYGVKFDDSGLGGRDEAFRSWLGQARLTRQAAGGAGALAGVDEAANAAEQWGKVAEELQGRLDTLTGATAETQGMRQWVRDQVKKDGLAQSADTIRLIASGNTDADKAMLEELAAVAREHALAALDGTDDIAKGREAAEKALSQALFGLDDVMDLSKARDAFVQKAGIVQIPGLEAEGQVDRIRALATALGLNPDDFVKGERGVQDVIQAAINETHSNELVQDIVKAPTTAKGEIRQSAWDELSHKWAGEWTALVGGDETRKPGDILAQMAGERQKNEVIRAATAQKGQTVRALTGAEAEQFAAPSARQAEIAQRVKGVTTFDELKAGMPEGVLVMKSSDPSGVTVTIRDRKNGISIEGHGGSGDEATADALKQLGVEPVAKPVAAATGQPQAPAAAVPEEAAVPQEVLDAEKKAERYRAKAKAAKTAYKNDPTAAKAAEMASQEANAKAAGMQASELRRKHGVKAPMDRTAPSAASATGGGTPTSGKATAQADELTGEQLAELDRTRESTPNTDAPSMDDHITAAEKQQVAAIEKIKAGVATTWGQALNGAPLPQGGRAKIEAEIKSIARQYQEMRAAAIAHSEARANFSMLDYGSKRGIDMGIAAFAPYSFWGTRQGRNFAVRIMENPQMLVNFLRYKDAMKKENINRGYRQRFEGGWEIPIPGGGYSVFIDPTAMMFPFADLIKADFSDSTDSKSALAQIYDAAGSLGLRPAPWIDIPLRMSNLLVDKQPGTPEYDTQVQGYGKESVGGLIPQAAMLKGATALAGIGTPGGIDAERPIRAALGMPQGQPFEPYTLARSVRDLAAEAQMAAQKSGGQFENQSYLIAQATIAAYGNERYADLLEKATAPEVAQEMSVSVPEAQAALVIIRDAARRAGAQKGVGTLASGLLGQRVQVLTPGEKLYGQMQTAERGQAYSPYTQTGSRADVLAARAAMPALAVGQAQYATLPGETQDPREIATSARKDEVYNAFQQLTDAVIANRPWDRKAVMSISNARSQAIDAIGAGKVGDWKSIYAKAVAVLTGQQPEDAAAAQTYQARSIAGASPAEAEQIRKDEVARYVGATRPQFEQFQTSGGQPDYAAYSAAIAQWETLLPRIAAQSPMVAQVVAQAKADGKDISGFVKTISQADIQAYWSRSDSPVEAAQRAYFDQVYTPAMTTAKKGTKVNVARLPQGGAVDTAGLIALVQKQYPGRWTNEELKAQLGSMAMPDLKTVAVGQMSTAAQGKQGAEDSFAQYVAQKFGARGATAYQAYTGAADATEKAKLRQRYAVLAKILAARTEYLAQNQ